MLQVLNMVGKVRIRFKIEVIDNACLVAHAAHLMTHGESEISPLPESATEFVAC